LNSAYKKLAEKQRDMQRKMDVKISEEIGGVQQLLRIMAKPRKELDENQSNATKRIEEADTSNSNKFAQVENFAKQNWYASLMMYNSY
jgi:superfamily I DNA and/or RNA helicase